MINIWIDFWYFILMPDSTLEILSWDLSFLREYWFWFFIVFLVIGILFFIWFYVFSKPTPYLNKVYYISVFVVPVIFALLNLLILYLNRYNLNAENWNLWVCLYIILISYLAIVEIFIIIFSISLLINVLWKKSATRRYPIKSIK